MTIAAKSDDFFVTRALAFLDQAGSQPPYERIEPESGLDKHVQRGGEIVATAHMPDLACKDGFEVGFVRSFGNAIGPDEGRPGDSEHPWVLGRPRQQRPEVLAVGA